MKKVIKGLLIFYIVAPLFLCMSFAMMLSKGDMSSDNTGSSTGGGAITVKGDFAQPFSEMTISNKMGGGHKGIDFVAPYGTPIMALADAEVYKTSNTCAPRGGYLGNWCPFDNVSGGGNYVVLRFTYQDTVHYVQYAHMSSVSVTTGATVKRGDVIGAIGNSGNSTGTHLHLEAHTNGIYAGSSLYLVDVNQWFSQ